LFSALLVSQNFNYKFLKIAVAFACLKSKSRIEEA
jgi:hypothetical protein